MGCVPFICFPLGFILDGVSYPFIGSLCDSILIHWLDFMVLCSFCILALSLLVRNAFSWINVALYLCLIIFGTSYLITEIGSGNHVLTLSFTVITVYVPMGIFLVASRLNE